MPKKVMISAGEASGELYGALLTREIRKKWPEAEIIGIGGNRMKAEGVQLIARTTGALGLTETIKHWGQIIKSFKKARDVIYKQRPDVLVLIDYPDFNIALAKRAKTAGVPILYYVSPQVWAWRPGRVKKIASLVEKIAVLFPFEVDIYKKAGLPCEFVGHPIAETININQTKEELKRSLGLDPGKPLVSLLPGSRPSEIKKHEAVIKEVAETIHREFPDFQIVIPLVYGTGFSEKLPEYVKVLYDRTTDVLACSEASAVASGTATLQTALLGIPMVVFYRLSPLTIFFAKLLVKVRFISVVNIIAGKEIVLELIQKEASAEKIFSELKRILTDNSYRQDMTANLQKIMEVMGAKTASVRVASIVGEIAGWNNTNV